MSSREEKKEVTSRSSYSESSSLTATEVIFDNFNRALDETKTNIKKSIDETRTQIPRYTNTINEYHEQVFQTAKDMADSYVDSTRNSHLVTVYFESICRKCLYIC